MPPAVATREAVFQIADELVAQGHKPGPNIVQQRTGGSFTTVSRLLKEWEAERQVTQPVLDLPPALVAHATELARTLWTTAHADAQRTVQQLRAESEHTLAGARAELADALAAIERLEGERAERESTIANLQQTEATLRAALAEAEAQQRVAEARTVEVQAAMERAAAEGRQSQERLAEQLQRLGEFGGELAAVRRQVEEQAVLINRFALTQQEGPPRNGEADTQQSG